MRMHLAMGWCILPWAAHPFLLSFTVLARVVLVVSAQPPYVCANALSGMFRSCAQSMRGVGARARD